MKPKLGRPRKFDETEVKAAITEVFRNKGFAGTSLDDLALATNLTRPSLYGAFGDKQSMFLLAIDTFAEEIRIKAGTALHNGASFKDALAGFYGEILDIYYGSSDEVTPGCLIFATALADAGNSPEIRNFLRKFFDQFADTITNRIEELLPAESINQSAAVAEISIATLHSLAIRARVGEPRSALEKSVEITLDSIDMLIDD